MKKMQAAMAALQKQMLANVSANGGTRPYAEQARALKDIREAMIDNVNQMDKYRLSQKQVLTEQAAWQKKIMEGKSTFKDLARNHKMLNGVLHDQLALQRAVGASWTQSTRTGKHSVDLFIPRELSSELATTRQKIGLLSNVVNVASDNMVKWGKNTQWAGRQLMVGFTVPMGIAAAATGKFAYDMDKAITRVVKVYGDASQGMQETTDSIRNNAMETAKAAARIYGQSADETLGIMADLAASGKAGLELQQATMSTTRAAILGELDWQDAVKATISMQEVYKASQEDLADNWNYINAMENQTVLSAQDFVTAIPKVSGVMNALGADLKQTGTLMTAFKAAGIDAAEGANALKSINFRLVATYGKGLETFQKYTGQNLRSLIDETNGETIPSLTKFADAIKNLSAPERVAVTRDVFGIYQGSKAMMLLEQMTEKTDQWQQALNVAQNSNIENAAIAQAEMDRQSERPFKKLDKAVQSIKIELAEMGEAFLGPAAALIDGARAIIAAFNDLSPGVKTLLAIGAGIVAIAGPAIMLLGLFANLAANGMKLFSTIGILATKMRLISEEEKAQIIVSKMAANAWDTQTSAVARLTQEVKELTGALVTVKHIDPNIAIAGGMIPTGYTQKQIAGYTAKSGKQVGPRTEWRDETGKIIKKADPRYQQLQDIANATTAAGNAAQVSTGKFEKFTRSLGHVSLAAGAIGAAFGPTDGVWGVVNGVIGAMGVLSFLPGSMFTKMQPGISRIGGAISGKLGGAINAVKSGFSSMLPMLMKAGPIIGLAAMGAVFYWNKLNTEIEESKKKIVDFNNYTKDLADILGYSYTAAGQVDVAQIENRQDAVTVIAEKMKDVNAEATAAFSKLRNLNIEEKWTAAIAKGIEAKMHGATVEQAKETARVAMHQMNATFEDADFEVEINARINFDDPTSMINMQMRDMQAKVNRGIADSGANWWESFWQGTQLSQAGGEEVKAAGNEFWNTFFRTSQGDRKSLLEQVAKENDQFLNDAYAKAVKKNPQGMKGLGMNNSTDFAKKLSQGTVSAVSLGMSQEEFDGLRRRSQGLTELARAIAVSAGITDEKDLEKIFRIYDLFRNEEVTKLFGTDKQQAEQGKALSTYSQLLKNAVDAGEEITDQKIEQIQYETRVADGTYKTGGALEYFADVSRGAASDAETFNKKLEEMGFQSVITYEALESSWRNIMEGAQGIVLDEAARRWGEAQEAALDAVRKNGERELDEIEARSESSEALFERKREALSKRQDREQKSFKSRWDLRKKTEEAYYDAKIEKVEAAIKAEQRAEESRQRIFEAERTRIQRLAELYGTNIDINAAINSGNLDEAAKLTTNSQATIAQWAIDDSAANQGSASEKRIETLEAQKDSIVKARDARMEALDAIEDREKEILDARLDAEKKSLEAAQNAAKKKIEAERNRQQEQNRINEENVRKAWETKSRQMEGELAVIRAFIPRNQAEMQAQANAIEGVYDRYGIKLGVKGEQWAGSVASALTQKTKEEGAKLDTVVNWTKVGADIAGFMLKGAFGMSPDQFNKWMIEGVAPAGSLMGKPLTKTQQSRYGANKFYGDLAWHSGGVVSHGGGSGRTGHSGEKSPSEVNANLLVGEGVITRKGMNRIGKAGLDYINKGGGLPPMGGGQSPLGGVGMLNAATAAAANKALISKSIKLAADRKAAQQAASVISGVAGVATGTTKFYPTGKQISLGTGRYPGGANLGYTVRPTNGVVTSNFGPRNLLGMSFHNGIDLASAAGTPIKSVAKSKVLFSGWSDWGYGNYVMTQSPDGTILGYGHQSSLNVKAGQSLAPGQMLGRVGSTGNSTGPHLHLQTGRNGIWFDPRSILPQLNTGAFTMSDGIAKLHREETVLTKPLTREFKEGVKNFANDRPTGYNVTVEFNGPVNSEIDIKKTIKDTFKELEREAGPKRRIGK